MIKFWSKFHIQILMYSFTRENRFPLIPSQYLPVKQENSSSSFSRHVNNSLSVYFSSILNSIMEEWKYRSRELLKDIPLSPKNNKRADRLCMKFSSIFNTSAPRCLYPLFQNQCLHFLLLHLFWRMSQHSGQHQQNGKRRYCQ